MAGHLLYRRYGKRGLDLLLGSFALVIALPIVALLAAVSFFVIGRPVFFVQDRPGRGGRLFPLVKFRSMSDARDAAGQLLSDGERLGRYGRLLRRSSLDELPELWNVIKGEMSLVGPRPLLPEYLGRYSPEQARRHDVRPGITGWAEVHGRNALSWEDRFRLDVWYVDHLSLPVDLRVLAKTIAAVLTGKGVTEPGVATRSKFEGSSAMPPGAKPS